MTSQTLGKNVPEPVNEHGQLDYHALNALLNLYDENGQIQFDKDREAANQFFLQHVNQNTVYFHDLEEKIDYLLTNKYYEPETIEKYDWSFIKDTFKRAYSYKFRFKSFLGAYKYYTSYTLKTFDGRRYLERVTWVDDTTGTATERPVAGAKMKDCPRTKSRFTTRSLKAGVRWRLWVMIL